MVKVCFCCFCDVVDDGDGFRLANDVDQTSVMLSNPEDGSVILSVKLPYDNWTITYILSDGTDAEILKPLWLKEEMRKLEKKLAEFYET